MNIVLLEPEIPPNTGNVARLVRGHQVRAASHRAVRFQAGRRAAQARGHGLLAAGRVASLEKLDGVRGSTSGHARLWFIESNGPKLYSEAKFSADDYLVFGRETAGLPKNLLEQNRENWLRIPMFNALNLSNRVR
jgi:tRNA (cytidine/uridine-2'-O-)-methyltransferase